MADIARSKLVKELKRLCILAKNVGPQNRYKSMNEITLGCPSFAIGGDFSGMDGFIYISGENLDPKKFQVLK